MADYALPCRRSLAVDSCCRASLCHSSGLLFSLPKPFEWRKVHKSTALFLKVKRLRSKKVKNKETNENSIEIDIADELVHVGNNPCHGYKRGRE